MIRHLHAFGRGAGGFTRATGSTEMYAAETIAAIATPPGIGGIGIVRVSGPRATEIAGRVFSGSTHNGWESHRLYAGAALDRRGRPLDKVLAVVMRAPHSYTGEDVLELHCHGSPFCLRELLDSVLAHGARLAEPGEFTRRAFLNGRLDLAQAEAVTGLIHARSATAADAAAGQLFGRLSERLAEIRSALIDVRSRLEAEVDFAEEDISIDPSILACDIERLLSDVTELLSTYHRGRLIRDGLRATITGKPNVGKSSLLNALLGVDRAIVTPIPGTTRDVIEEAVDFCGLPVVLSDTAGMHCPSDPVEEIGVRRARDSAAGADVVIAVFDGSEPLDEDDAAVIASLAARRVVAALNKCDLPAACDATDLASGLPGATVLWISALHGTGLDALRAAVVESVAGQAERPKEAPLVTLSRHRDALDKAAASLRLALASVRQHVSPELVAVDIQDAADHIGSITGVITSEEVLDRIFSEFCIGK